MTRVCIVTGASKGIGLATAKLFAANDYKVVSFSRTVRHDTPEILWHKVDVSFDLQDNSILNTHDGPSKEVQYIVDFLGRVDVVVNNAAVLHQDHAYNIDPMNITDMVRVNIRGAINMVKAAYPHMKKQGGGVIINISSLAAWEQFPGLAAYGGTKAFINAYTAGLAAEGAKDGVKAYAVCPGAVETDTLRRLYPDFPAEKCLQPEEVARVILDVSKGELPSGSIRKIFKPGQETEARWKGE